MKFDLAVIGAGSAGCAAAGWVARTTAMTVALIEAGPDYGPFDERRWPKDLIDPNLSFGTHDWGYIRRTADPQGQRPYSRAKVVGGCSSHNQCAAIWPFPDDFRRWSDSGVTGWSFAELSPLIRVVESQVQRSTRRKAELAAWQRYFLETALEAGYEYLEDLSWPVPPIGVMPFHVNIRHGVRWNSAFTFIDPERHEPRLVLFPKTLVERVILEGRTARGVVCRSADGQGFTIDADRIVLSAGAIGSPLVLMRSGVGPADRLRSVRVDCQIDLAGVGENLHDHHGVSVGLQPSGAALEAVRQDQELGQPVQSQVILRERSTGSALPDLHILPSGTRPGESAVNVMVMNMAPRSRGLVTLSGPDVLDDPQIDFGFLTHPDDLDVVLEGVDRVRRLSGLGEELAPAGQGDEEVYVRNNATSYAHAGGTCRMGIEPKDGAVVNAEGRVYGLDNIWVADASIMPSLPLANTNMTCYLIGCRAAEVLAGRLPGSEPEYPQAVV